MTVEQQTWHVLSVKETFAALETGAGGLQSEQAAARLARYGPNEIGSAEKVSKLKILWAQIRNPLVFVLLAAAVVSFAASKIADTIVVAAVIVINLRIPAAQVVPGDLILLDAGAKVPADARLIEAINLEVDEAMLTGESLPLRKTTEPLEGELPVAERTNLVYGGTIVTSGRGRAVVYATGSQTEMGKIATLIHQTEKAVSPLQKQTLDLGKKLGFLALSVATVTLIVGLIRGLPFRDMFLFSLASAVSSIPEGLPAVMSITLAVGVNRMAKRNAIIRRLQAVDTLGAATVICTDKTGTLTTNQMTVRQIHVNRETIGVTGEGFAPEGRFERDGEAIDPAADADLLLALRVGALCNNAHLVLHQREHGPVWEIRGDPTEGALVVAMSKARYEKEALEIEWHRIDELPFSSKTKLMATFHQGQDGRIWVLAKGAPETVLGRCAYIHADGTSLPLKDSDRAYVLAGNDRMAGQALRVLGLAYQVISPDEVETFKEALEYGHEADLIHVGLVGMMDPPRAEAGEAVARCKSAGIRVIMATGDYQITGEAIARQVGILNGAERVLTGADVEPMSDAELDAAIEGTAVFARVSPEHKHRIVESLRRQGHVVAMTGDGVNMEAGSVLHAHCRSV